MKFTRFAFLASAFALTLTFSSVAQAFPKLPGGVGGGGGGGGNWGAIAKEFNAGMVTIAEQSAETARIIATLLDALDLKQQAAELRGKADNIQKKGDSLGADDLDSTNQLSDNAVKEIEAKMSEAGSLSAEQKTKMAEAAARYIPTLVKAIEGVKQVKNAASQAQSAGTPGMADGMTVVNVAKNIPTLAPKAISFVGNSIQTGTTLMKILREKDVAVPKAEMPSISF